MDALRFGVLGCADIAWRKMLPALTAHPRTRLVAVASRTAAKAARYATRFGCDAHASYEELLRREDVDAVYIPLPPALHAEWISKALAAGKHVLGEKPLTTSLPEARAAVAEAERRGLLLMENFTFVRHPVHDRVRALVEKGTVGEPRMVTAAFGIPARPRGDIRHRPELGGGSLLDQGVYPVRAVRLLSGEDLSVMGAVSRRAEPGGVDVSGAALVVSADGVIGQLSYGMDHYYRCEYAVWGSEGSIRLGRAFTLPADQEPTVRIERGGRVEESRLPAADQWAGTLSAFTEAVAEGRGFAEAGEDILRQAGLVDRIRAAADAHAKAVTA